MHFNTPSLFQPELFFCLYHVAVQANTIFHQLAADFFTGTGLQSYAPLEKESVPSRFLLFRKGVCIISVWLKLPQFYFNEVLLPGLVGREAVS